MTSSKTIAQIPDKAPNTACGWCASPLYRSPSRLGRSKSGLNFCNRSCKENAQIDPSFGISPDHYGTGNGKHSYRRLAFSHLPNKCAYCFYDKWFDVLQVHHIDRDRENNELENLIILCPTCHLEIHKGH